MPAVARAEPEPDEVPAPLGLVVVLVRRAAVDDDAVVEDLDLPRLEPEVETVRVVLEELVHEAHRSGSGLIQRAPGLLVAAEGVPGIEAGAQAPVPREHRAEVGCGGIRGLVFLMVTIEGLVETVEQLRRFAEEVIVGG